MNGKNNYLTGFYLLNRKMWLLNRKKGYSDSVDILL